MIRRISSATLNRTFFFRRNPFSTMSLPKVYVRAPEDERMSIQLTLESFHGYSLDLAMERSSDEDLDRCLERMTTNIAGKVKKKGKKKLKTELSTILDNLTVNLYHKDIKVAGNTPNKTAWIQDALLEVGETKFQVELNPPTVKSIRLPNYVMLRVPIYPTLQLYFADEDQCDIVWYRNLSGGANKKNANNGNAMEVDDEWIEVARTLKYSPSREDLGHELVLRCTPRSGDRIGNTLTSISNIVQDPHIPDVFPFEKRHSVTKNNSDYGSFRMVSYNILADLYADSDFSRDYLYPYCPPECLSREYRYPLVLWELKGYNADLICLQELDRRLFLGDLSQQFVKQGFSCYQKIKTNGKGGDVPEGTGILVRNSKFNVLEEYYIDLKDGLENNSMFEDLKEKIQEKPVLCEKIMTRTTGLHALVLESKEVPGRKLCVATTHLYFHPKSPNIRLIQAAMCLTYLSHIVEEYKLKGDDLSVIICGDFNSTPEKGVSEFMTQKMIPANHMDWYVGGKDEFVENMKLQHDFNFISACGYPRYTNYVGGFEGCLDYIYAESDDLLVTQTVPLPSHEEVIENAALPNQSFPSDHLALVCDMTWKVQN